MTHGVPARGQRIPHCGILDRTTLAMGLLGQHIPHCEILGGTPLAVGQPPLAEAFFGQLWPLPPRSLCSPPGLPLFLPNL